MGVDVSSSPVQRIGETAGVIYRFLESAGGPVGLTVLTRELGLPRDTIMQGIGWLAREHKLAIVEDRRKKSIGLVR